MQLIWVPDALETVDEAQATLVAELQAANIEQRRRGRARSARRVQGPRARSAAPSAVAVAGYPVAPGDAKRVYLVHDRGDREAVGALQAELERRGHVVMLPLGEGSEAEAREVHEMSMVLSDAVIIFYGTAIGALGADEALRPREGARVGTSAARSGPRPSGSPSRSRRHKTAYETDEALVLDGTDWPRSPRGPGALPRPARLGRGRAMTLDALVQPVSRTAARSGSRKRTCSSVAARTSTSSSPSWRGPGSSR